MLDSTELAEVLLGNVKVTKQELSNLGLKFLIRILVILLLLQFLNSSAYAGMNVQKVLLPDKKLQRTCKVLPNTLIIRFKPEFENILIKKDNIYFSDFSINRQILKPEQSLKYNSELKKKNSTLSTKNVENIIKAEEPLLRTCIIEYQGDEAPEKYAEKLLKSHPEIEIAEPYCLDEILKIPNDPYAPSQKMLLTIKAFNFWDTMEGDTNVIIGISDIGVDQNHEDLTNSIATNWKEKPNDSIDYDHDGYIGDFRGYNMSYLIDGTQPDNTYNSDDHGTNVAGIAGATYNNKKGIAGVGGKCRIFPIKAGTLNQAAIDYGYESILYAAARGCKVLNCSWGSVKQFSSIDQSVIDYAVAKGVSIVAAGGNIDNNLTEVWYPAAYKGVLGVGEVDQYDGATGTTTLGSHILIMAPGDGDYYTAFNNTYEHTGSGTSYASPVVAGGVALIRSKYPQLDAMQALEFTRQCVDDISDINRSVKDIIPGRLDLLKAAQTDPFSIPSVRPVSVEYRNTSGDLMDRLTMKDTATVSINAYNYLGAAHNLKFVLSIAHDVLKTVIVLDSVVNIDYVETDTALIIKPFKLVDTMRNTNKVFLRCDIYGNNNYHDFFLIPLIPSSEITTFSNDSIKFSMSDRGKFGFGGYNGNKEGVGFVYKNKGNQIFSNAGIIATENSAKIVCTSFGSGPDSDDFDVIKPLVNPDRNIGIIQDSQAYSDNKIGIRIQQTVLMPPAPGTVARIDLSLKNVSDTILSNVAVGYYIDWDIGANTDSNSVSLFSEAVPDTFGNRTAATAEIAQDVNNSPYFSIAVISNNANDIPQAAGLNYDATSNYQSSDWINALNSGTSIQSPGWNDISMLVGMKFACDIAPGDSRYCSFFIGGADTKDTLTNMMKSNIIGAVSVKEGQNPHDFLISLSPQPARDYITVTITNPGNNEVNLSICDILGQDLISSTHYFLNSGTNQFTFDLRNFNLGVYFVKAVSGQNVKAVPVVVVK
jgi:hypothetical protein